MGGGPHLRSEYVLEPMGGRAMEWFTSKMPVGDFWRVIESCRAKSESMPDFNRVLEQELDTFDRERLFRFHNRLWSLVAHIGGNDRLSETLFEHCGYSLKGDSGDRYGGWLVAQGREFCEWLMLHPEEAASHCLQPEDEYEGETVFFSASRVWHRRTGEAGAASMELCDPYSGDE